LRWRVFIYFISNLNFTAV
jgi:hypothetical protein